MRECVLESVRKEVENCDCLDSFFFLQSLAGNFSSSALWPWLLLILGGTGSGLGSLCSELLRDEYPARFQLHAGQPRLAADDSEGLPVVWPYSSGDVVVQAYNSTLSLSHPSTPLTASSACITVVWSWSSLSSHCLADEAHDICSKLLGVPRPSLSHLNKVWDDEEDLAGMGGIGWG